MWSMSYVSGTYEVLNKFVLSKWLLLAYVPHSQIPACDRNKEGGRYA